MIDHINMNVLDNRKENLRKCTKSENARNTEKRKDNTSGAKGVCWSAEKRKWRVTITVDKKTLHVGYFNNKNQAIEKYNEKAVELHKEFARLNIINKDDV